LQVVTNNPIPLVAETRKTAELVEVELYMQQTEVEVDAVVGNSKAAAVVGMMKNVLGIVDKQAAAEIVVPVVVDSEGETRRAERFASLNSWRTWAVSWNALSAVWIEIGNRVVDIVQLEIERYC
jgi:hypothetical protein